MGPSPSGATTFAGRSGRIGPSWRHMCDLDLVDAAARPCKPASHTVRKHVPETRRRPSSHTGDAIEPSPLQN